jgi:hypothetical protein
MTGTGTAPEPGSGVKETLTPDTADRAAMKRGRREYSNASYAAFVGRVLRAMQRRLAGGDIESLPDLVALHEETGRLVTESVHALRADPHRYSWADIGRVLGISRQAAHDRFRGDGARRPGGQPGDLR